MKGYEFGIKPSFDVLQWWGARAIYKPNDRYCKIDIPMDRQSHGETEHTQELKNFVNSVIGRAEEEFKLSTDSNDTLVYTDGNFVCHISPRGSNYVMEIVTEVEVPDMIGFESKRIASIDLGVNNFVTLTNNIGVDPIIINGKGVKSINQYYNKRKSKLQSELKKRNDKGWSKRLEAVTFKRDMRIKNFIHHTSKFIVQWCMENEIDTLVVGHNKNWKQESDMGKETNQKFVYLPYNMLLQQLSYKCENVGIKYIESEEKYTSGTSFLDGEEPIKENYNKSRRVKRGLFQSGKGLVNSDVNGSLQIMKKVFPDAFSYGIVGGLTPTIISVTKVS